MSDQKLSVKWKQSFSYDEGEYQPMDEEGRVHKFVSPYETQKERAEEVCTKVLALGSAGVYKSLYIDHGLKPVKVRNPILWLAVPRLRRKMDKFIWGDALESSTLLLLGSAIRHAKSAPDHQVDLSGGQWADLALQQRDLNPHGERDGWYEATTGIPNTKVDLQIKTLGRVATAVLDSDILAEPQLMAFYGQIAELQTVS